MIKSELCTVKKTIRQKEDNTGEKDPSQDVFNWLPRRFQFLLTHCQSTNSIFAVHCNEREIFDARSKRYSVTAPSSLIISHIFERKLDQPLTKQGLWGDKVLMISRVCRLSGKDWGQDHRLYSKSFSLYLSCAHHLVLDLLYSPSTLGAPVYIGRAVRTEIASFYRSWPLNLKSDIVTATSRNDIHRKCQRGYR